MKKFIIILIGIILAVGSFIGSLCLFINFEDNSNDVYKGIVTFDNANDFANFKTEIANKAVRVNKLDELNTNYPVLVSFSIEVDNDIIFNYGSLQGDVPPESRCAMSAIIALVVIALYLSIILASDLWD